MTDDGDLEPCTPFARAWPQAEQRTGAATTDALPAPLLAPLRDTLAERTSGLLLFGSAAITDHSAIDLVAASLSP